MLDLRRRLKLYFPSDGHRIVNNRNRYSVVFEHCLCLVQSEYLREKHSEKKSETKKGVAASEKSNSSFLNNLSKKTLKRCSRRCLLHVEQLLSKSNKQQPMDVLSFATCCLQPDLRSVINDTVFFPSFPSHDSQLYANDHLASLQMAFVQRIAVLTNSISTILHLQSALWLHMQICVQP